MKHINDLTKEERLTAINVFKARMDLRDSIGGCPPSEARISGKTNCFNCDECWIAALKNI